MKIKIFLPIFLLLSFGSNFYSSADNFKCKFGVISDPDEEYPEIAKAYSCNITEAIPSGDLGVISGNHVSGKTDDDVSYAFYDPEDPTPISKLDAIFCRRFKNLKVLAFRDVKIQSIDENALNGCSKFEEIHIERSGVTQIPENLFSKNTKLESVILRINEIVTLPEKVFSNLKELKELNLRTNKIKTFPANIFESLAKLETLMLNYNEIGALNPVWFRNLNNLKHLNIDFNKIKDLPKNVFTPLTNLLLLSLGANQLTIIHADSFPSPNNALLSIHLWYNQINAIDEKFIDNSDNTHMYLDENVCSSISIHFGENDKNQIKQQLQECIDNYQPRPQSDEYEA